MRFVCVSLGYHPDLVGGAWRVAASQCEGLAARGHDVEVITVHPGGELPTIEERAGVRIKRCDAGSGGFRRKWKAANAAVRQAVHTRIAASSQPTLVIQHHAYLGPATRGLTAPILHVFHGPWGEEYRFAVRARHRSLPRRLADLVLPRLLHRVERASLRRAHRLLVLSRHFAEGLRRWHPGLRPPVDIVPGGVDFRRFAPPGDRAALRRDLGLSDADFLAVAVRRLDPRMGLDLLVEAFARLAAVEPRAVLWLTGRGEAEQGLRLQIERLGLEERVRLLGFVPDDVIPRLLGAADVALMPSLDLEGFGLATAESLACGTPVLGSRAGATPELLEPLDPGLLFASGSSDALADRLLAAVRRPESLPSREQCASFARERFSWDHQVLACEKAAVELTPFPGAAA